MYLSDMQRMLNKDLPRLIQSLSRAKPSTRQKGSAGRVNKYLIPEYLSISYVV